MVSTSSALEIANPATGGPAGRAPALTEADVERLVADARAAQPAWAALGFDGRAATLTALRDWLIEHRDRLLDTLVAESGKTRDDAVFSDWAYCVDALSFWAGHAEGYLRDEDLHPHSPFMFGRSLAQRYVPRGVIGVVGPWNFPLAMCLGDGIPALAAGNAVVLKPASLTPLSSLVVAEGWAAVGGDPAILAVATGPGGRSLVDHVDMVMFTGSTETGRAIARAAAERLIPASLELGGNDPMIVLADADLARAANAATYFGMLNAGQVCQSVERVYAEAPVYEDLVARIGEAAAALRQEAGAAAGTVEVGAITDPAQLEIIDAHVRDAVDRGARLITGGTQDGSFYAPTVLADCTHEMRVMREETFGPVVALQSVADADEAVALANDSDMGLSASVFTRDLGRGRALARRVEAGGVYVNDVLLNGVAFGAPFGGWKTSGVGSRGGADGIRKYCKTQLIGAAELAPERELYYYPNDPRRSALIENAVVFLQGTPGRALSSAIALAGRTPLPKVAGLASRLLP